MSKLLSLDGPGTTNCSVTFKGQVHPETSILYKKYVTDMPRVMMDG